MSYIDDISEANRLADYLREKMVGIVDKYNDTTPREEVVETLQKWIADGNLVLKSQQGKRSDVARAVKDGKLFHTSFAGILATTKEVSDMFEHYINCNRIMDANKVSVRKGLHTQYLIDKACTMGDLVRIDSLSNALSLYVD